MRKNKWTEEEIQKLKDLIEESIPVENIAAQLGRSIRAVLEKKAQYKLEYPLARGLNTCEFMCPYFHKIQTSRISVSCHNIVTVTLAYKSIEELDDLCRNYCLTYNWDKCPIAEYFNSCS